MKFLYPTYCLFDYKMPRVWNEFENILLLKSEICIFVDCAYVVWVYIKTISPIFLLF